MRINKFVLDANIWVSYLITNKEQRLTDIVIGHKITFFYCEELVTEIKSVLNYPRLKRYHVNVNDAV